MNEVFLFLFFQIVFESLPVSSSGHMFLLQRLFDLCWGGAFYEAFEYAAQEQFGAIKQGGHPTGFPGQQERGEGEE